MSVHCIIIFLTVPLGSTQDEQTLKQLKVTKSAKFMVIGSTINDLLKIATPTPSELQSSSDDKRASASKEPLCKQTVSAGMSKCHRS